jgi:gluconate 2-dehydrogenase alpha chain
VADMPTLGGTQSGDNGGNGDVAWGAEWKENMRENWDSYVPVSMQGESLPYEDQFLDLDPTYRDAWGQPLLRITFDWHQNDYRLYRYMAQRCKEILVQMGASDMDEEMYLEPYNIHEYQSTHPTGGAIMGTDPGNSVTNKYGQVWDTPNVFVTGAALYPQNPGANPTETLCALAYLTAEGVTEKYVKDPNRIMV